MPNWRSWWYVLILGLTWEGYVELFEGRYEHAGINAALALWVMQQQVLREDAARRDAST